MNSIANTRLQCYSVCMKRLLLSLLLFAAGLASAMTPAEFTALYEKQGKTAADCYKLYEAYSKGEGTEQNDSKARKWLLAAHRNGMVSVRKELMNLPWRKKLKLHPTLPVADADDETARKLGKELFRLMDDYVEAQERKNGPFSHNPMSKEVFKAEIYQMTDKELEQKIRHYIKSGAALNPCHHYPPASPVALACKLDNMKLVSLLIAHGADPSAGDNAAIALYFLSDNTLQEATYSKYDKIEKPVFHANSHRVADTSGRSTTTHWRSQLRKMKKDYIKKTRKTYKAEYQSHAKKIAFLLDHGVDIQMHDDSGRNLMHLAASRNSSLAVSMLAEAGLSPDTPLDSRERVRAVDKRNTFSKAPERDRVAEKELPLHVAIEKNNIMTVRALLKAGANPHSPNHEGTSPREMAEQALKHAESDQQKDSELQVCKDIISAVKHASRRNDNHTPEED